MGKLRILFIKNRCERIARHKKRRTGKTHNFKFSFENSILYTRSQKTFMKNDFYDSCSINNGVVLICIPKIFSILKNPNESLKVLKKINWAFMNLSVKSIVFDYAKCDILGLDASVITDLLVLNGKRYRRQMKVPIDISGTVPSKYNAGELFYNSGLLKHLKITKVEDPLVERLDPFTNISKKPNYATNQTILYINNCLKRKGYELNIKGIDYFNNLIGEIIGNADEHSGENGEWYVSGHFTEATDSEYGKGNLVFISIGNTIYENLKYNVKSTDIDMKLKKHLEKQRSLFDFNWNEELSLTVFGLQYKISSERNEQYPDRGTGTIKFIDSFSKLGKTINGDVPLMSITSGNAHIFFDGTYVLKENENNVPVIAFNKENDIEHKPDSDKVKLLSEKFPGVIISVEFYIDKRYFDKIREAI